MSVSLNLRFAVLHVVIPNIPTLVFSNKEGIQYQTTLGGLTCLYLL